MLGKIKLTALTWQAKIANRTGGKHVKCPVCNSEFASFLPFGEYNTRTGAVCPKCESKERTRLYWLYLNRLYGGAPKVKTRVLHVAPEPAVFWILKDVKNVDYFPIDLNPEYLPGSITMDITDLQFEDDFFDVILCSHVLEHIIDDAKAMSELYRVLHPKGFALMQVPLGKNMPHTYEDFTITAPAERQKAFWSEEHVRIYGDDFRERLKKKGFHLENENYVDSFSSKERKQYGLPHERMYFIDYFAIAKK